MDFEKIRNDFKKRYGRDCAGVYFVGKSLTFFSGPGITVGCAVSAGGATAVARRGDGRFIAEFSDNSDYLSFSLDAPPKNGGELVRLLSEVKSLGVKPVGAEMLVYYNTDLPRNFLPLFLTSLGGFCDNVPPASELIKHFPGYAENILSVISLSDRVTVSDGGRRAYYPLEGSRFKIILCRVCDGIVIKRRPTCSDDAFDAADRLRRGDTAGFCELLSRETERILRLNKCKKAERLFRTAMRLGDAYGFGILEDGGIFAVTENRLADTFMQRLGAEYEQYFGARPEFYVTQTESSGIEIRN